MRCVFERCSGFASQTASRYDPHPIKQVGGTRCADMNLQKGLDTMANVTAIADVDGEERAVRKELAALYRLFMHYGWTDLIDTHLSARLPGIEGEYLINSYGEMFDEITASSLLHMNFDGEVVTGDAEPNMAGHLIHTAVLKARPEINYVLHSHTRAGCAVSAMKDGLLALSQHGNAVLNTIAYHDYQVVTRAEDECALLARDLGPNYLMIMRNHGLLACGRTAAEAFYYHYFLEMACKIQVDVLSTGVETVVPEQGAIDDLAAYGAPGGEPKGERYWNALVRMLERTQPDYKN